MRPADRLDTPPGRQTPFVHLVQSPEVHRPGSPSQDRFGPHDLSPVATHSVPPPPCRPVPRAPTHKRSAQTQVDTPQAAENKRYRLHEQQTQTVGFGLNPEQIQITSQRGASLSCVKALIEWSPRLHSFGFTHEEMTTLALVGTAQDLRTVAENIKELRALKLTSADICEAVRCRGARSIEAMVSYGKAMQSLGFTAADLVKVTRNYGGKEAIACVVENADALRNLGFSNADLMKVAKKGGANQSLQAVMIYRSRLRALTFSNDDIVRVAKYGGAQAIVALISHEKALRDLQLNNADILALTANGGSAQAIGAMLEHREALSELGFSDADIVKMASHIGGARTIAAVVAHAKGMQDLGITVADIINLAKHDGGSRALMAVAQHKKTLHEMGFSRDGIMSIAAHNGGAQSIEAVVTHERDLKRLHFSCVEIVMIAKRDGGAQAIKAVVIHAAFLAERGFRAADLMKLAARHGGSVLLVSVVNHEKAPQKLNVQAVDLMRVAAVGGAKAIRSMMMCGKDLKELQFDNEQIVRLACEKNGADAIESISAAKETLKGKGLSVTDIIKMTMNNLARQTNENRANSKSADRTGAAARNRPKEARAVDVLGDLEPFNFYVELGFPVADSVKMAARVKKSKVFGPVMSSIKQMRARHLEFPDIRQLYDADLGSVVINSVFSCRLCLRRLGLSGADFVSLIAALLSYSAYPRKRDLAILSTLKDRELVFEALGFRGKDLVRIAGSENGDRTLAMLGSQGPALSAMHFSRALLVSIATRKDGSELLSLALEFADLFLADKLTPDKFVQIANSCGTTVPKIRQLITVLR